MAALPYGGHAGYADGEAGVYLGFHACGGGGGEVDFVWRPFLLLGGRPAGAVFPEAGGIVRAYGAGGVPCYPKGGREVGAGGGGEGATAEGRFRLLIGWLVGMLVTLPEAKEYLRVDAEDALILGFIGAAQEICMDVARVSEESDLADDLENARAAVLYTVAYLYEHREEADHRGLMLTLRALLFGVRREGF